MMSYEFINGNTDLKPADEPIIVEKFKDLPGNRSHRMNGWNSCAATCRS